MEPEVWRLKTSGAEAGLTPAFIQAVGQEGGGSVSQRLGKKMMLLVVISSSTDQLPFKPY